MSADHEIPAAVQEQSAEERIKYAIAELDVHRVNDIAEIFDYSTGYCNKTMKSMFSDGELTRERDGRGYWYDLADEDEDESEDDAKTDGGAVEASDSSSSEMLSDGQTDMTMSEWIDSEFDDDADEIVEGLEELSEESEFEMNRRGQMPVDRSYDWEEEKVDPELINEYIEQDNEYTTIKTLIERRKEIDHRGHFTVSGPAGAAKTMLAENLALEFDAPLFTIQCSDGMEMQEVLGSPTLVNDETWWLDGNGTKALMASKPPEEGGYDGPVVLLIDEVNRTSSRIKAAIMALLDHRCEVVLDARGGEKIQGNPDDLIVVSTMNKGPGYMTNKIDNAEKRRLGEEYEVDFLGRSDFTAEVKLIADQTVANVPLAKLLVETANELRDKAEDNSAIGFGPTTALLMDWAKGAVGREGICDEPVVDAAEKVFISKYYSTSDEERTLAEEIVDRNVGGLHSTEEEAVRDFAGGESYDDVGDGYLMCDSCAWYEDADVADETVKALGMCPECDATIKHESDSEVDA